MSLKIKPSGVANGYIIEWAEGYKSTTWAVDGADDVTEVLRDILKTVEPNHVLHTPLFLQGVTTPHPTSPPVLTPKVDKASLMEEQRLMNGGAALGKGLAFEDVPIMDDNDLRSAPMPEGWTPVNYAE
jgi:CBS domain-containing protein